MTTNNEVLLALDAGKYAPWRPREVRFIVEKFTTSRKRFSLKKIAAWWRSVTLRATARDYQELYMSPGSGTHHLVAKNPSDAGYDTAPYREVIIQHNNAILIRTIEKI